MGQPAEPIQSPTRAATPPPDQKTLNATRTEIIVLAIGILFLVSQLILVIWLFAPRAFARKPREHMIIGWQPMDSDPAARVTILSDDEDDGRPTRRRNYRRCSTWNGRSVATSRDGRPVRRRKSTGLKPAELHTSSSSDQDSDSSDWDSSLRKGFQNTGLAAASLAIPIVPLPPRQLRSPVSSPELEPETEGSDVFVHKTSLMPAAFSPRSPRAGLMNTATIGAIFQANERKPGTTPMGPPVMHKPDLANGFDDPLGVRRCKALFGNDNSTLIHEKPPT